MVAPLPTAPDPMIRFVWVIRGILIAVLLLPLGWVPLVALAYAIAYLGVDVLAGFAIAAIVLVAAVAAGIVAYAFLAYDRISYSVGEHAIRIRDGILFQRDFLIPFSSIEEVVVVRGPLLNQFQLASVRLRMKSSLKGSPAWGDPQLSGLAHPQDVVDHIALKIGARAARPPIYTTAPKSAWQVARPPRAGGPVKPS